MDLFQSTHTHDSSSYTTGEDGQSTGSAHTAAGITTQVHVHCFKDCRIWPSGVQAWDWRVHGTQHVPGTQRGDIEDLLYDREGALCVDSVVISRGMQLVLQVHPHTLTWLDGLDGVEVGV
jgi:hypothetical protein